MAVFREPSWKSYIVRSTNPILSSKQCNELIKIGQNEFNIDGKVGGLAKQLKTKRVCKISWIPFSKVKSIYEVIENNMQKINSNFFGFDNMQIVERGQYTEYSKGGFYDWHIDNSVTMANMPRVRKISMTLLLNNPEEFTGGELEWLEKGNKAKLKQGSAVFFASFLLHRVKPIKSGNRKSLVMWFNGSPFK